ncbi:aminodeoxychorismate synthase, component I [Halalkalibacter krulwichiae]|nr:aminodeoxychorismate synthase, component I [Halalkalibacter krulwichiae]
MLQQKKETNRTSAVRSCKFDEKKWFARYLHLSAEEPQHVLLESGRGGRYSIIGLRPFATISGKEEVLTIEQDGRTVEKKGPLLASLKETLAPYSQSTIEGLPPFQGGAIGYFSYDIVREIEKLPPLAKDDLALPDVYFLLFNDVFIYDHLENKLWIIVNGEYEKKKELEQKAQDYMESWEQAQEEPLLRDSVLKGSDDKTASLSDDDFCKAVEKIQQYIAAGDVFQVNLSVRQSRDLTVDPIKVYEALRKINPSPYMSYFHTPSFQFVSASPELLVKKNGTELSTRPIAGTRSRGKSEEEDEQLANTLINNEKERAEHVMLVDLERNDLGRVSAYGTVEVDELMVIEKYSHVMHIVSNVKGTLAEEKDLYDVIRATFPGGTITGAPKVRTMEIIEELEPVRRGIYTGSIGWIGFNENMELNIAIRTMVCKGGQAHVQAGAGIVIDSIPSNEYKESLKKARALWHALEQSEEEMRNRTVSLS